MVNAAAGHTWQAFTRNAGYALTGALPLTKAAGVLRHLGVDTCQVSTPYTPERYGRLAPGCGVVLNRDGVQQFSGMVGSARRLSWDGKEATITVQCLGDDQHLADRLVLPSPLLDPTAQTADYWTFPRSDTLPLQTQAAQQIRNRFLAGQPIFEDWSWRGMPPFVDTYNDALTAAYYAATGKSTTDPNASAAWLATYIAANSTPVSGGRAAPASSAIWQLIYEQAGPGAAAARRVPTLYLGPDPVAGTPRFFSEQFGNVLDTAAAWGVLSGADLGVRLTTTPDGLRADVYVPRDVADGVRFSASLGNLTGFDYEQQPPGVTVAVAAGQGDLHLRYRRVATSTAVGDLAWGRRIERYIDQRDEADLTKLQTSADDAVATSVGTVSLGMTAQDSVTRRYGVDWNLGDRVAVYVGLPGQATAAIVTDLVREVSFDVDGSGRETITPAVGNADAKAVRPGPTQAALANLAAGFARLNRNK